MMIVIGWLVFHQVCWFPAAEARGCRSRGFVHSGGLWILVWVMDLPGTQLDMEAERLLLFFSTRERLHVRGRWPWFTA